MYRSLIRLSVVVLVVLALHVAPASAQSVCDNPANLTSNCGFDYDIGGWSLGGGDSFAHSTDGNYAPGSIEINASLGMGYSSYIYQCIDGIAALSTADGGFWVRVVTAQVNGCYLQVSQFTGVGCSGDWAGFQDRERDDLPSTWNWVGLTFAIDPTAVSVAIEVGCYNVVQDFTVRLDDVYLGPSLAPVIFQDDFESGDWSKWSAKAP